MTKFTSEFIAAQRYVNNIIINHDLTTRTEILLATSYNTALGEIERQAKWIVILEKRVNELDTWAANLEQKRDNYDERIAELEQERRWIPVSERLPETNMFNDHFSEMVLATNGSDFYVSSWCGEGKIWTHPYIVNLEVTHWQPLPQPPKEGE